ncbi:hypothetical protein F442_22734 [Phytophthora nicotianae P10297]|uniref:Uncharacterized protein n=1 Tax=Phytophthora nicotianae P10297 TaxID=1317064 RepID=W2XZQ0_PHYNI|nr:hypothetical protein F442_22734 [Phytophthora nicotianae P10297]
MHEWYGPCQLDTGHTHGDNGACEGDVRHGRCPNGIEVQYVRPTHHGESSVRSAAVDDARVTGDDAVWQVLTGNPVQARDGDELVVCADGESSAHRLELL